MRCVCVVCVCGAVDVRVALLKSSHGLGGCQPQGALRWKHEAGDFYDEYDTDAGDRIGEERAMHLGEMSWNDFRYSVMQQLPHAWFHREVPPSYRSISPPPNLLPLAAGAHRCAL
jgi:hypothetical protein